VSRAASLPDLEIALRAKAGKRQEQEGADARPDGFGLIQSAELRRGPAASVPAAWESNEPAGRTALAVLAAGVHREAGSKHPVAELPLPGFPCRCGGPWCSSLRCWCTNSQMRWWRAAGAAVADVGMTGARPTGMGAALALGSGVSRRGG
jgi:hypothetical protein